MSRMQLICESGDTSGHGRALDCTSGVWNGERGGVWRWEASPASVCSGALSSTTSSRLSDSLFLSTCSQQLYLKGPLPCSLPATCCQQQGCCRDSDPLPAPSILLYVCSIPQCVVFWSSIRTYMSFWKLSWTWAGLPQRGSQGGMRSLLRNMSHRLTWTMLSHRWVGVWCWRDNDRWYTR
jgi:hypothetical protein